MAIDPLHEQTFSLTQATKLKMLPLRRGGKRPAVSTLFRWAQTGVKGIRLETIQVGGTKCTSREALARFFAALSGDQPVGLPSFRSVTARQRAAEAAERALEAEGA